MSDLQGSIPQIQDIVSNHGAYRPDLVADLEGEVLTLVGPEIEASVGFESGGQLRWSEGSISEVNKAETLRVRPGIYFVDYVHQLDPQRSTTLVLDLTFRRALVIDVVAPGRNIPPTVPERLRTRDRQSAVDVTYRHAGIDTAGSMPFARTRDLVGKICRFHYSDTHVYDHLYLSEKYHAWFCRKGPDEGLGDFDDCDYFKIAEDLYLFSWQEKLIPCVGVALEDHAAMRSVGKIFGANSETGSTANVTVGARMVSLGSIPPL